MEDDLMFYEKWRQPHLKKMEDNLKTFESKNNGCGTVPGNLVLILFGHIV
jgi:hypothetical protein